MWKSTKNQHPIISQINRIICFFILLFNERFWIIWWDSAHWWHASSGTSITRMTIPSSIESINSCLSIGCNTLKEVEMREGAKRIEPCTFEGCNSLAHVSIPGSMESIDDHAFTSENSLFKNIIIHLKQLLTSQIILDAPFISWKKGLWVYHCFTCASNNQSILLLSFLLCYVSCQQLITKRLIARGLWHFIYCYSVMSEIYKNAALSMICTMW